MAKKHRIKTEMALELVSGSDFSVQVDVRGGPGRSEGVPGAISAAQTPKIDDFSSQSGPQTTHIRYFVDGVPRDGVQPRGPLKGPWG